MVMNEEDVKALTSLNEDVAAAVRWLAREGVDENIRMIKAAILLTRVGLRIEKMIGDAEEAMHAAHDPGGNSRGETMAPRTANLEELTRYAKAVNERLEEKSEIPPHLRGLPGVTYTRNGVGHGPSTYSSSTNNGPTVRITDEERMIGTVIADASLLAGLADIIATDFDDPLMGALLHALREYARMFGHPTNLSPKWIFDRVLSDHNLGAELLKRGPGYLERLAANRMEPSYFGRTADRFRRWVASTNPSRNIGAVA